MFGSAILDVAIGIVFIYIILSMMCSTIREGIEAWLKTRAAYLERGIRELLSDVDTGGLTRQLYQHPLIDPLYFGVYPIAPLALNPRWYSRGHNLPSYIPSRNFALALLDMAARGPSKIGKGDADPTLADSVELSLASIRAGIPTLPNATLQRVVSMAVNTAGDDLETSVRHVEAWFDSAMDRISGMYKRASQLVIFLLGLGLAIGFNINTLALADYLYGNPSVRQALVAQAERTARSSDGTPGDSDPIQQLIAQTSLPIGWAQPGNGHAQPPAGSAAYAWHTFVAPALGWLLTAFAVTLGAPFWFDVLNKIMTLRSSIKPAASGEQTHVVVEPSAKDAAPASDPLASVVATPVMVTAHEATSPQLDGCGASPLTPTLDQELPCAQGGVAQ
jgi:hypothetical protein